MGTTDGGIRGPFRRCSQITASSSAVYYEKNDTSGISHFVPALWLAAILGTAGSGQERLAGFRSDRSDGLISDELRFSIVDDRSGSRAFGH